MQLGGNEHKNMSADALGNVSQELSRECNARGFCLRV